MSEAPRRAFLRQLVTLPLIGGGVSLIGQPTAVAEPVTMQLLEAYKTWLGLERRFLVHQMADDPVFIRNYQNCFPADADRKTRGDHIGSFEWYVGNSSSRHHDPAPYTRAALVLSAVGCDWRDHDDIFAFGEA